jgi:hypothetical protein
MVQIVIHELPSHMKTPAFQPFLVHQPDWPLMAVLLEMLSQMKNSNEFKRNQTAKAISNSGGQFGNAPNNDIMPAL